MRPAIESVAENFGDSWVAPLLACAAFGLSGAYGVPRRKYGQCDVGFTTRQHTNGWARAQLGSTTS